MTTALDWHGDDTVFEDVRRAWSEGLRPDAGRWRPAGAAMRAWTTWQSTCAALDLIGLVEVLGLVVDPAQSDADDHLKRAFGARAVHRPPTVDAAFVARRHAVTEQCTPDPSWAKRHRRNLDDARDGVAPGDREALWLVHGTAGHLAANAASGLLWAPHPIRAEVLAPGATLEVAVQLPSVALEALAAADDNERAFEAARSWHDVHGEVRERLALALDGDAAARDALEEALSPTRPGTLELRVGHIEWPREPVDGEDPERPIVERARIVTLHTAVAPTGVDLVARWLREFDEWRGPVHDEVLRRARPRPQ